MIPRIRGRTAEIQEPIEDAGKWVYELSMWDLAGENMIGESYLFGPFDNEEIAKVEGKKLVQKVSQEIEKEMTGKISDSYFDLKSGGIMRPWKEHS